MTTAHPQHGSIASLFARYESPRSRVDRAVRARWLGRAGTIAPLVTAAAGGALALAGRRGLTAWGLAALGASAGLGLLRWQLERVFTERAAYEVEERRGNLEVRRYLSTIHAETLVDGAPWKEALDEGFHRLAGYVLGGNAASARPAPSSVVALRPADSPDRDAHPGERMAMTAPVVATVGGASAMRHMVAFVLPGDRTLASLPHPRDPRVHVRAVPRRRMAVLSFRGSYRGQRAVDMGRELLRRVRKEHLIPKGPVFLAAYDPPWTLPLLRRNEVMIEVEEVARH